MPNNRPNGYYDPKTGRFIPFSEQNLPVRAQNQPVRAQNQPVRAQNLPVFAKNPPTRLQKPTKKKRKINLVLLAVFAVLFFVIFVLPFAGNNSDSEDAAETEPSRAVESEETNALSLYQIEDSPTQPETEPAPAPQPEPPAAEPISEEAAFLSEPEPDPIRTWTPERDFTGAQEQPEDFYPYLKTYEHEITEQYVLNTSSHKIHKPDCKDVSKIKAENYSTTDDPETWLSWGYTNCGHCGGCG